MKKLAVLLPTYNAAVFLNESINSVLNQTFRNFDLYIYDDCSTDDTEEIILQYQDPRIFYLKNTTNLGIAKTLNKGLEELLPHYQYIARMDADDCCYPQRFEKQLEYLENNPNTVLCGTQGYWLKNMELNPGKGWAYPTDSLYIQYYLLFGAAFGHSSIVLRSQSFINFDLKYDETVLTCEDWELWMRVAKVGEMINLPDFLMKYRILENSNHRSPDKMEIHLLERSRIISRYWADFNIILSAEEVYEYYYGAKLLTVSDFVKKIKLLISVFNVLYLKGLSMDSNNKKGFSYMLARRILSFWKRSSINRCTPIIWFIILTEVKFISTGRLIKSQLN